MDFSVGERVAFHPDDRHIEGVIAKYNRKTVTVVTDDGQSWNVGPGLLRKVQRGGRTNRDNVIDITAVQGRKD